MYKQIQRSKKNSTRQRNPPFTKNLLEYLQHLLKSLYVLPKRKRQIKINFLIFKILKSMQNRIIVFSTQITPELPCTEIQRNVNSQQKLHRFHQVLNLVIIIHIKVFFKRDWIHYCAKKNKSDKHHVFFKLYNPLLYSKKKQSINISIGIIWITNNSISK